MSKGSVYASSISDSFKGTSIVDYLKWLKELIQDKLRIYIIRWLILFDNDSTYISNVVEEFIKEDYLWVIFIPV